MPQLPNRLSPDTPLPDNLAYINDAFDRIDDENQTKIIRNGSVPQLLLGYQKGGFGTLNYGLKASKINPATSAPYDVTTATNDQLAFSTAFDSFKVVGTGTTTIAVSNGAGAYGNFFTTLTHSLGYSPLVIATISGPNISGIQMLPYLSLVPFTFTDGNLATQTLVATSFGATIGNITTTTVDFAIVLKGAAFNGTFTIRYYLLQETAN